jgi:site-specific recombinase XerD
MNVEPALVSIRPVHSSRNNLAGSIDSAQRFGFHNFRHSLATFLINKGKDVKTIQGLFRHAKASTTLDIYSQAIDASKLAAHRTLPSQLPAIR